MYYAVPDSQAEEVLSLLEDYEMLPYKESSVRAGFLVVTGQGKYPFYLMQDPESCQGPQREFWELATACNGQGTGYPQWIAYMSSENITSAQFRGEGGGKYSSNPELAAGDDFLLTISTEDPESIQKISSYLKEMSVTSMTEIVSGEENFYGFGSDPGRYDVRLSFRNGAEYFLTGSGGQLVFQDAHEQVFYTLEDEDSHKGLRDLVASLPEASVQFRQQ